ncbi:ATP-binding protein [Streptomyces sp. FBKL.4005]|uniref:NACHT domain-containing protein n=1 Tax=Streptomyces sp. FBKL.4005 TaxID=2015515 RepID=UPI000B961437|nr:NACHT domain-containing protein [Streptomyces sp. FBKL.4005]OYP15199.1 ATP-binding protein [Streptomyces sp. FBKL.4005]
MSAEAAALRLGTTVAKAAAQMWLGGRRREQERRMDMAGLVRLRVPGLRFQRGVQRQFEEIADAVYDRLAPFLEREFPGLEEGSRQAVVDGVCDTFAAADLSDEAVLAADANPAEIVRRVTGAVRPPAGLGEAESRLYERLFVECVEYYVRIVQGLPVFEERALSELLARTTSLGTEIARLLERLPDRSLFAPEGTDRDGDFRRRYLELVSNSLDEVELFRRTSDRAGARVRLSVAYVSLRATGDDGGRRRPARSLPMLRPDMSDWEETGGESAGMRVEAALGGATRVLLRGEAGSGKTTLLRWLAVTAARGAFTGELAAWNGLTPIFVKLREYSGRALPVPEVMLDSVAGQITGVMPKAWVERQLVDGRALLLIDGVDELLDGERRGVREWLRGLLAAYGEVRIVVTSRPAAARADWLRREEFTALHLDRMTAPDLAAFVRQWHQAVRELGEDLPCTVEELPRYEQSLLTSLKDRPHLQSLAGTPLLAAMLCAMHLNRGSQLPRDRMELYRNALHTLVHERDADRNVPSAVDSRLSLNDKLVLLRDLAWRLSDNNRSEIPLEQAAVHVGRKLAGMRHLDGQDGGKVLEQLRDRSGLLRSPAEDRLDFVHRTFQEYLAAEEATEEDRIGNLVGRAHLDLWRETIIMAAGHANRPQREELLGGILDRAREEPRYARKLRLLAAACQETVPEVSEGLAGRLEEAVSTLLPPRRQTDPPALAAVGTSLLRRLPRSLGELTTKAAVQTVRTAALIGGGEALGLLEGYTEDQRRDVVEALIEAWGYFDADAYADRVMAGLPLEGHCVELTHSAQLRAVARLRSLTWLWIRCGIQDLAALPELPALTQLACEVRGTADLSLLTRFPALGNIDLLGAPSLRNPEALADLPALRHVQLPLTTPDGIPGLPALPELSLLAFTGVTAEARLDFLAAYRGLKYVTLSAGARSRLPALAPLSGLPGLHSLWLFGFDARDLPRQLAPACPGLSGLLLDHCLTPGQLDGLPPRLEWLTLLGCETEEGPVTRLKLPGVRVNIA